MAKKLADLIKDETKDRLAEQAAEFEAAARETLAKGEAAAAEMAKDAREVVTSSDQYVQWKGLTSNQRFLIVGVTLIAFVLLVCWLVWPKSARAQECKADIPDDLQLVCVQGRIGVRSVDAKQGMMFDVACPGVKGA